MSGKRMWVVAAVMAACSLSPGVGRAGWLTLTAGRAGQTDPTAASEFWFDAPGLRPVVAVDRVSGGVAVQAATGGGTALFGGLGTPVVLDLTDGSASLSGGSPPAETAGRGPDGNLAGTPATAAPVVGGSTPTGAALLGLDFAEPGADASRVLTVSVTDGAGAVLGGGTLAIPDGGWWVLGLGHAVVSTPDPGPIDPPADDGGSPTSLPTTDAGPVVTPPPATPGVPEPGTLTLAAVASGVALLRRRRTA